MDLSGRQWTEIMQEGKERETKLNQILRLEQMDPNSTPSVMTKENFER